MKPRKKLAIALGAGAAFALVAASPAMAVKRGADQSQPGQSSVDK